MFASSKFTNCQESRDRCKASMLWHIDGSLMSAVLNDRAKASRRLGSQLWHVPEEKRCWMILSSSESMFLHNCIAPHLHGFTVAWLPFCMTTREVLYNINPKALAADAASTQYSKCGSTLTVLDSSSGRKCTAVFISTAKTHQHVLACT